VAGGPGAAGSRSGAMGGMGGAGAHRGEDDTEHETPDYLKSFEYFEDGRLVAPPVIGVFDDER
ncbi:MAG: PPE family protein, partial [Mycobacteriaceae bacterium]